MLVFTGNVQRAPRRRDHHHLRGLGQQLRHHCVGLGQLLQIVQHEQRAAMRDMSEEALEGSGPPEGYPAPPRSRSTSPPGWARRPAARRTPRPETPPPGAAPTPPRAGSCPTRPDRSTSPTAPPVRTATPPTQPAHRPAPPARSPGSANSTPSLTTSPPRTRSASRRCRAGTGARPRRCPSTCVDPDHATPPRRHLTSQVSQPLTQRSPPTPAPAHHGQRRRSAPPDAHPSPHSRRHEPSEHPCGSRSGPAPDPQPASQPPPSSRCA